MDIAVCDDNLSDREIIRQQLSIYFSDKFIEYNIDSYENGVNLIYSIEDGEYYDIIFLDMYMDKLNGIQVAEKLRNMNYKGKIIFLTTASRILIWRTTTARPTARRSATSAFTCCAIGNPTATSW